MSLLWLITPISLDSMPMYKWRSLSNENDCALKPIDPLFLSEHFWKHNFRMEEPFSPKQKWTLSFPSFQWWMNWFWKRNLNTRKTQKSRIHMTKKVSKKEHCHPRVQFWQKVPQNHPVLSDLLCNPPRRDHLHLTTTKTTQTPISPIWL